MTNTDAKDKIRQFISRRLKTNFEDDLNLFTSGLVDSLFAMELVLFVEKEFKINVENADLDLKNFNSVNAIADFIVRKVTKR